MAFHGDAITQDPDVKIWDPRTGWTIRRPWRGTPSALANQQLALQIQGIRSEYEPAGPEGGYDTLFGIFGAEETQPIDQTVTDQWDLLGNMLEKDLWTHPKVKAMFDQLLEPPNDPEGIPTDTYIAYKQDIDALVAGSKTFADLAWWPDAFPNTKKFVRALMRGVTSFPVSQYVLRNTRILASNYSIRPVYTRVGKVMTTAQVQSIYNPPATLKFALPDGYWVEQTPNCEQDGDKWQLTREWWHADDYDPFIYDPI